MAKAKVNKVGNKSQMTKKKNKAVLTLFIILFPSLLIALTTNIIEKVLLFFYVAILIKNFIDDYSRLAGGRSVM